MRHIYQLLALIVLTASMTSCVTETPQEGEEGELVVGYIDEFGTSVERYALDGECHCTSTGVDEDCVYEYFTASEVCDPEDEYLVNPAITYWVEQYGYFEYTYTSGFVELSCGFPFGYDVFLSGEMSVKAYGSTGILLEIGQLSVTDGSYISDYYCYIGGTTYGSCLMTGIDPNEFSGYLFLVGHSHLYQDDRFLGVRVCYDSDSSD